MRFHDCRDKRRGAQNVNGREQKTRHANQSIQNPDKNTPERNQSKSVASIRCSWKEKKPGGRGGGTKTKGRETKGHLCFHDRKTPVARPVRVTRVRRNRRCKQPGRNNGKVNCRRTNRTGKNGRGSASCEGNTSRRGF